MSKSRSLSLRFGSTSTPQWLLMRIESDDRYMKARSPVTCYGRGPYWLSSSFLRQVRNPTSRAGYTEVTSRGFSAVISVTPCSSFCFQFIGVFSLWCWARTAWGVSCPACEQAVEEREDQGDTCSLVGGAVWDRAAAWPANEGGAGSSHHLRDRLSPQVDRREENHLQV